MAVLWLIIKPFLGPAAMVGCAVLAFMLIGAKMETGHLRKANSEYHRAIFDPVVGWQARLATCQGSLTTLEGALSRQSAAVAAAKADGERRVADATKAAVEARAARAASDRLVARLTTTKAAATCEAREAASLALVDGLSR